MSRLERQEKKKRKGSKNDTSYNLCKTNMSLYRTELFQISLKKNKLNKLKTKKNGNKRKMK